MLRVKGLILVLTLVMLACGCEPRSDAWRASSPTNVENASASSDIRNSPQTRPTPTLAPQPPSYPDDNSQFDDWRYSDEYVVFTQEPVVCNGVLSLSGYLRSGAEFVDEGSGPEPTINLYHESEKSRTALAIIYDPIASILKPLEPGWEWTEPLDERDIVATKFEITLDSFDVEAPYTKDWLFHPEDVQLSLWGAIPGDEEDSLRTINLASC